MTEKPMSAGDREAMEKAREKELPDGLMGVPDSVMYERAGYAMGFRAALAHRDSQLKEKPDFFNNELLVKAESHIATLEAELKAARDELDQQIIKCERWKEVAQDKSQAPERIATLEKALHNMCNKEVGKEFARAERLEAELKVAKDEIRNRTQLNAAFVTSCTPEQINEACRIALKSEAPEHKGERVYCANCSAEVLDSHACAKPQPAPQASAREFDEHDAAMYRVFKPTFDRIAEVLDRLASEGKCK